MSDDRSASVARRVAEDRERQRLAELDRANRAEGRESWLLLEWTLTTYHKETPDMAKTPRKPKQTTQAAALVEALNFASIATKNDGVIGSAAKHVRLIGKQVVAYDGQMSAGHPIAEELTLCPQIDQLSKALSKTGKTLTISETATGRLSIKGEKLQAYVPCAQAHDLPQAFADQAIAPADDRIKAAFKCCGTLASEADSRLVAASLLLRGGDCTGTNGAAILQYWHGVDLPPAMVLPKVFCAAVAAAKPHIVGFGASFNNGKVSSVTFHFEGGAWLKSACYADEWPDIEKLWLQPNYVEVPKDLFEAIDAVDDFHEAGHVTFANNAVQSHASPDIGAQYAVPGLQAGKTFAGKLMKQVAPFASLIDLNTYDDRAFFMGGEQANPVRGIVMAIISNTYSEPVEPQPEPEPEAQGDSADWSAPGYTGQGDGWSQPAAQGGWSSPATSDEYPIDDSEGYDLNKDIPF